jgi:hypothetical protein
MITFGLQEAEMPGKVVITRAERCEGVLDEIASIGGGIFAGRAAVEAEAEGRQMVAAVFIHRGSFVGRPYLL